MDGILATKLARFVELGPADRAALRRFEAAVEDVAPGSDLIAEGERPNRVHLLVEGWACRYKLLPNGKRQIVAFLVPGDLCDVHVFVLRRMDHAIGVLCRARVAAIAPGLMLDTMERFPRIARGLWWATLVDEAVLREWLANIGRREPHERVANLLCELWARMDNVGLAVEGSVSLPVTQAEIGDATALTPVTVNRVLQRLRRAALIHLHGGTLTILDRERLAAVGGFDPHYLHADPEAGAPPARAADGRRRG